MVVSTYPRGDPVVGRLGDHHGRPGISYYHFGKRRLHDAAFPFRLKMRDEWVRPHTYVVCSCNIVRTIQKTIRLLLVGHYFGCSHEPACLWRNKSSWNLFSHSFPLQSDGTVLLPCISMTFDEHHEVWQSISNEMKKAKAHGGKAKNWSNKITTVAAAPSISCELMVPSPPQLPS